MAKPLANIGVAITRPIDQAKTLTKLIQDAGGTVISFPLIEIAPLSDYSQFTEVIANIQQYDWVIFISSNAVQNGMPQFIQQGLPSHIRFAAIGPVTATELNRFGVMQVLTPLSHVQDGDKSKVRFDSESLLALPEMQDVSDKKVMIVRGVGGREILADTLKARGAIVSFAECYQRINPQKNAELLAQAWQKQQLHAIVVTSTEAMRHLIDLAGNAKWLKAVTICVNHARIAETASELGLKVKVSEAVGDAQMLTMLCQL
jgi:uroporphyrinogen-III synthase